MSKHFRCPCLGRDSSPTGDERSARNSPEAGRTQVKESSAKYIASPPAQSGQQTEMPEVHLQHASKVTPQLYGNTVPPWGHYYTASVQQPGATSAGVNIPAAGVTTSGASYGTIGSTALPTTALRMTPSHGVPATGVPTVPPLGIPGNVAVGPYGAYHVPVQPAAPPTMPFQLPYMMSGGSQQFSSQIPHPGLKNVYNLEDIRQLIDDAAPKLLEHLELDLLIRSELKAKDVITTAVEDRLSVRGLTRHEMVTILLDHLRRGPARRFLLFCKIMNEDRRTHILEDLGVKIEDIYAQLGDERSASIPHQAGYSRVKESSAKDIASPTKQSNRQTEMPEHHSQHVSKEWYISFKMEKDFKCEFKETSSGDYESFASDIKKAVKTAVDSECGVKSDVTINFLCQRTSTIFLAVMSSHPLEEKRLSHAISNANVRGRQAGNKVTYHVLNETIQFRGKMKHTLVSDIYCKKHLTEKNSPDRQIDLDTQYVRLKLLSNKAMGVMQRDELEQPHRYQAALEKYHGDEVDDEELVRDGELKKYVLIRGRAGIGKSTLVQRLLWKWANNQWANMLSVIFLLNLRTLITKTTEMELPRFLRLYPDYNLHKATDDDVVTSEWLRENQGAVGFIFDGIDEIPGFAEKWRAGIQLNNIEEWAVPLDWCFALMRRKCLEASTVIITSRPFADLMEIPRQLLDSKKQKTMLVELMGLTRERVMRYVDKNVHEGKRTFVKETLIRNPILLSVSAITFYCAALCQVLGQIGSSAIKLSTYTQITVYIMQVFMRRSLKEPGSEDTETTLEPLSKLAFEGLVNTGPGGLARLTFNEEDFKRLGLQMIELQNMRRSGLLMQTEVPDPEGGADNQILSQFVHLTIQELLAMMGLLNKHPDQIRQTVSRLSRSGQFNMALLFLYGLAFDNDNEIVQTAAAGGLPRQKLQKVLLKEVTGVSDDLQALQITHESQSVEVAQAVGRAKFPEEVELHDTKLTVVDVMAITFLLRHHPSTHTITLDKCGLDLISVKELAGYIQKTTTLKNLDIGDLGLDAECCDALLESVKGSHSLETLELWVSKELISSRLLAEVIRINKTLQSLQLPNSISSSKEIAEAIKVNTTLRELYTLRVDTDQGVKDLAKAIKVNTALQQLDLEINFKLHKSGADVLLEAMGINTTLTMDIFLPSSTRSSVKEKLRHRRVALHFTP